MHSLPQEPDMMEDHLRIPNKKKRKKSNKKKNGKWVGDKVGREIEDFACYATKIHDFSRMAHQAKDSRKRAQIKAPIIFIVVFFGAFFSMVSMAQLDHWLKSKVFARFIPSRFRLPSHDTVRRALQKWDLDIQRQQHQEIVICYKEQKGPKKGSIDGLRVTAIDGVELFHSTAYKCKDCLTREKRDGSTEYYHSIVVAQQVGGGANIIYDWEMRKPRDGQDKDEGESTVALRLIKSLKEKYGKITDVYTLDALYAKAPIIEAALAAGSHVVIRMKDKRMRIMQRGHKEFSERSYDHFWEENDRRGNSIYVQAWEQEGLTDWDQVSIPLRLIKIIRHTTKTIIEGNEKVQVTDITEQWLVTTYTKTEVKVQTIARIACERWEIENVAFRNLKTFNHIDHCFVHHPVAIEALINFQVMAFNLKRMYFYHHLSNFRSWDIQLREVINEMREAARWGKLNLCRWLWKWGLCVL
ncbi:transposase [Heliorestis convoluta]|uniref:Transposase DDE domain protein n=1 Tax=Heliorestis convoluta TaxID=356322 RepID=A0A5Q2MZD0_9FIRM|nr:transposase [Heliorestis convoluta]QGG48334.1 Transposase DDE domain protein [Heliorestis convoluta]